MGVDLNKEISKLQTKDFPDLEDRLKNEILSETEKHQQFEKVITHSQQKTEEEISNRLNHFNELISQTSDQIDEKVRISMLSSATGIASGGVDNMIRNKIETVVKQMTEAQKKEDSKSKVSAEQFKNLEKKFKALQREFQTLELSILRGNTGSASKGARTKRTKKGTPASTIINETEPNSTTRTPKKSPSTIQNPKIREEIALFAENNYNNKLTECQRKIEQLTKKIEAMNSANVQDFQ